MSVFLFILTNNIIPIFILIALGYILNKKFDLSISTLSKLNFYIFVPAFMFVNLYSTQIPFEMITVLFFALCILFANMLVATLIAKVRGYDIGLKSAFLNSVMFYNSGNIGIPLITLVFSSAPYLINGDTPYLNIALTAHIMVLLVQSVTLNTIGFINAGRANGHWKDSLSKVLKMPTIYVIPITLVLKFIPFDFTVIPIWDALNYASRALVSVALLTLGIQLSRTKLGFNRDIFLSVFFRLLVSPLIALFLIYIFKMDGIVAQAVLISSALPTAVNTALIAVEYDNHPNYASQVVMASTLLCSITLVSVIYFARILYPIV